MHSPCVYMERKEMDKNEIKDMTVEQFIAMKKAMDEAENDTTPYAISDETEGLQVVGDPNKTELKKYEYTIYFAYPPKASWKQRLGTMPDVEILEETPNYIKCKRTFKDVWIPPRIYTSVQTAFAEIYQFFNVITEDGSLRDLTDEEIIVALRMLSQDMIEAMCHAVATILRIPENEEQCMVSITVIPVVMQMINDFPEIINGMDFFTEKSSETDLKAK